MAAIQNQDSVPIRADAFRALGESMLDFRANLHQCAIELAKEEAALHDSTPVITLELLQRALGLAYHRTVEKSPSHPFGRVEHDGNRSKVA
jgi:hypothetical protein